MSVEQAPYYWIECDKCAKRSTADSEHSAWADEEQAHEDAAYAGWSVGGGSDLCLDCQPRCSVEGCSTLLDEDAVDGKCVDCVEAVS